MLDLLADNPVITVFLVVGVGALFGLIPFGPVRFGAAGALFVGLAFGAVDARLSEGLELVKVIGLALFVYTVGLASGPTLIRTFRRQAALMAGGAVVLIIVTLTTLVLGTLLGIGGGLLGGVFAGTGTSTPTLAAAIRTAGNDDPAVGYALTYAIGVVLGILAVHLEMSRPSTGTDGGPAASEGLVDLTIVARRRAKLSDVPGAAEGAVRFSFLRHGTDVQVAEDRTVVEPNDRVVAIGTEDAVRAATEWLGARAVDHLAHDRREVDYRRVLLSNPDLAGRTIGELAFPERFGGVVSRIRRGDLDLLARDDVHVQLGDRLRVVVPRGRMGDASHYLGDAERKVSEVDAVSLAFGLTLGFLLGLVTVPLGSLRLSLGVAAGPLVVGIALGWLERTGPIVWSLPSGANLTLRQIGLLLFLATVGLSSGPALASSLTDPTGLRVVVLGLLVAVVGLVLVSLLSRRAAMSPAHGGGLIAGFVGNPSLLAFANHKTLDERINDGYATLFVSGQVVKVILVQVIVGIGS